MPKGFDIDRDKIKQRYFKFINKIQLTTILKHILLRLSSKFFTTCTMVARLYKRSLESRTWIYFS